MNLREQEVRDLIASYARGIVQHTPGGMIYDGSMDETRVSRGTPKAQLKPTVERMLQLVNELP